MKETKRKKRVKLRTPKTIAIQERLCELELAENEVWHELFFSTLELARKRKVTYID